MMLDKKKLFRWAKVLILLYCGIGIILYYIQDIFIFLPKKLSSDHVFLFEKPFEEILVPLNSQDTLSLVKFFPRDSVRKGIVIYYHGNKQNVEHYAESALNFTSRGYEVWMEDYPGYGKSRGERTESKLYEQALQVRKMAAGKYGPDHTIIYGRSLGSCLAAYVASVTPCKSLVLETPYFSIPDLLNSFTYIYPSDYMSAYKLPTWKYVREVSAPIIIFHGTRDWVIPYRCAAKLRQYLKKSDEFVTIKKGGHNNLAQFMEFQQCIDSLLR